MTTTSKYDEKDIPDEDIGQLILEEYRRFRGRSGPGGVPTDEEKNPVLQQASATVWKLTHEGQRYDFVFVRPVAYGIAASVVSKRMDEIARDADDKRREEALNEALDRNVRRLMRVAKKIQGQAKTDGVVLDGNALGMLALGAVLMADRFDR